MLIIKDLLVIGGSLLGVAVLIILLILFVYIVGEWEGI